MISRIMSYFKKVFRDRDPVEPPPFQINQLTNYEAGCVAILISNDQKTPMMFVVKILEVYFALNREDATRTMLEIHTEGSKQLKWFRPDVATNIERSILQEASKRGYPLKCKVISA